MERPTAPRPLDPQGMSIAWIADPAKRQVYNREGVVVPAHTMTSEDWADYRQREADWDKYHADWAAWRKETEAQKERKALEEIAWAAEILRDETPWWITWDEWLRFAALLKRYECNGAPSAAEDAFQSLLRTGLARFAVKTTDEGFSLAEGFNPDNCARRGDDDEDAAPEGEVSIWWLSYRRQVCRILRREVQLRLTDRGA